MRTTLRATAVAATALLSLSLVACSSDSSSESTGAATSAAPAASAPDKTGAASASATEASTEEATAGEVPEGYTSTEIPDLGIAIAIPSTWMVLTPDDANDEAALDEAATLMGTTADALSTTLQATALVAIDPEPSGTFASNLNVIDSSLPSMLSQEQAALSHEAIGATSTTTLEADTANGPAAAYGYTLEGNGITMHGSSVFVPGADGSYATLTVVTDSEESTTEIVQAILDSLA